jgi:hypothetical protein
VLRDGFDVEGVCAGWSVDLASILDTHKNDETIGGSLEVYEDTISDPKRVVPSPTFLSRFSYTRETNIRPI